MSICVGKQEMFRPRMHTDGTRISKARKINDFGQTNKKMHRKEETKAGLTNDHRAQFEIETC